MDRDWRSGSRLKRVARVENFIFAKKEDKK